MLHLAGCRGAQTLECKLFILWPLDRKKIMDGVISLKKKGLARDLAKCASIGTCTHDDVTISM